MLRSLVILFLGSAGGAEAAAYFSLRVVDTDTLAPIGCAKVSTTNDISWRSDAAKATAR